MVINMQFANSHASKPFFYYVLQNEKMICARLKMTYLNSMNYGLSFDM